MVSVNPPPPWAYWPAMSCHHRMKVRLEWFTLVYSKIGFGALDIVRCKIQSKLAGMDENSSIFFTAPVHTFFGRKLKLQFLPEQFRNIYIHFHCQPCHYFVAPVAEERGREDQTRDWYIITLISVVYCSYDSATQLLISPCYQWSRSKAAGTQTKTWLVGLEQHTRGTQVSSQQHRKNAELASQSSGTCSEQW